MGEPVFIDTSFALALLDRKDQWHQAAIAILPLSREASRTVTTSAVLLEICDALCAPATRALAVRFVRSLVDDKQVTIVDVRFDLLRSAMDLFNERPDKHWSLTDCISFVVMDQMKVTGALTADHHFEQAGFVALMRS